MENEVQMQLRGDSAETTFAAAAVAIGGTVAAWKEWLGCRWKVLAAVSEILAAET
jgi:hypothetical protein